MKTNLLNLAKDGVSGLLNLAYPPACGICNKKLSSRPPDSPICGDCFKKIKKNPAPYCEKCGRSLAGLTDNVEICGECFGKNFYYERSWSCFLYEGVIREALHLLKYSGRISLANLFEGLLIQFSKDNPEILKGIGCAAAVPLHSVKLREREFNQAHILANAAAKKFNLEDLSRCLKRTVATRPQSELDKNERLVNVKGAFGVALSDLIHGKNILLVDDLFTTGATLNECARALKKSGAKKIHCLTFARGA